MELRHLRYFVAVAEDLSFTTAARRLNLSQPPLSMQIQKLEAEVGVPLLIRTSRRVELTAAGQAFLIEARLILASVQVACDRARTIGSDRTGRINIGLSGTHFQGPLAAMFEAYMRSRPGVSIVMHQLMPVNQLEALRSGHIDISISRTRVEDSLLTSTLLWDDSLCAALPRGHPLSKRKRLSVGDLHNEQFIMLKLETSAYAQQIYDHCVQAGFSPKVSQWVLEVPAVVGLVEVGLGVGIIPASLPVVYLRANLLHIIPLVETGLELGIYAVQRRNDSSGALEELVRTLKTAENPMKPPANRPDQSGVQTPRH